MEMTAAEWGWAIGQTLLVSVAAFVVLCAATSWVRYQLMAENALESEELGHGEDRDFRMQVMNRINTARRLRQPVAVVSLLLPGSHATSDAASFIRAQLRSADLVVPCGSNRVGLLLDCGSDKSDIVAKRIV